MTFSDQLVCPSAESLAQFSKGLLSDSDSEVLEQHLTRCNQCVTELNRVPKDDLFVEAIQDSVGCAFPLTPAWKQVIDNAGDLSVCISVDSLSRVITNFWAKPESIDLSRLLAPAQQPDEIGRLDHFRVLRVLGKGGMGLVLEAHDPGLNRLLALKIMLPQNPPQPDLVLLFQREAQALAAIHSDHVVKVFAVGNATTPSGIVPYLAMELLHGETLADRLLTGCLPAEHLLELALQISLGLMHVHAEKLLHRDIKPSNIWLEWSNSGKFGGSGQPLTERVKLLDFGLARGEQHPSGLTHSGYAVGTPSYMAPEQAAGKPLDQRTDLFSLGAVLYEMATGSSAFSGPHAVAIIISVVQNEPTDPAALNPSLPRRLYPLIRRLLNKNPVDRPASASEVWNELKSIQEELAAPTAIPRPARPWWKSKWSLVSLTLVASLAWLMFQIIWVETPHGTLVIDSSDPNVVVRISRAGTTIIDHTTDRRLKLDVGEYGIQLVDAPNGMKLSAEKVTITRKGLPIVKIHREQPTITSNKTVNTDQARIQTTAAASPNNRQSGPAVVPPRAKFPFDVNQAKAHQTAWAKYLGSKTVERNSVGMDLVLIPPGAFTMGSPPDEIGRDHDDEFQVAVTLTQPIRVGKTEVTQGQWTTIMSTEPWKAKGNVVEGDDYPATYVSWDDASEFCTRLSRKEGVNYRFLTEAEWEYCCRAGTLTAFGFGNDESQLGQFAWFGGNANQVKEEYAHQVAQKKPNAFGLYDMHGNIWEWCQDIYLDRLLGGIDPFAQNGGPFRAFRGGCWLDPEPGLCRSASRSRESSSHRFFNLGFRIALPTTLGPHKHRPTPPGTDTKLGTIADSSRSEAQRPGNVAQMKSKDSPSATIPSAGAAGKERDDNLLKMKFRSCPAGYFYMGSPPSEHPRNPNEDQILVTQPDEFWMGKYEVTQGQWRQLMETEPWKGQVDIREGDDYAATCMDWKAMQSFCQKLTEREHQAERLPAEWEYRLPTEAEWEYTCRAGTTSFFSYGDHSGDLHEFGWFGGNSSEPVGHHYSQPIGQKKPNNWGFYDFHGNVLEPCQDSYIERFSEKLDAENNLFIELRTARGGGWGSRDFDCRCAYRLKIASVGNGNNTIGFRVARVLKSRLPTAAENHAAGDERDDNGLKMKFRWCPQGTLIMGSPSEERGHQTSEEQVLVAIQHGFWMGQYEVTQEQWSQLLGTGPWKQDSRVRQGLNYPVATVTWTDMETFCRQFTEQERQAKRLHDDWEYRLPTEMEWEYACRARSVGAFYFSPFEDALEEYAWFERNAASQQDERSAHPVGLKKPNAWGLYDMHGNVIETCGGWFVEKLADTLEPDFVVQRLQRVGRGGGWSNITLDCRTATRATFDTRGTQSHVIGLRVVCVPQNRPTAVLLRKLAPN